MSPPDYSQPVVNMVSRHCANSECNAIETAEQPLKACAACKRVAYCNRACQKVHWVFHKPTCRAAVIKDQSPDQHEHEQEGEDISDRTDFRDEDGNRVLGGVTYPAGTYIEWFEMPSPKSPNGCQNMIRFTKSMSVWVASLSDDDSKLFEQQIVEGCKCGLEPLEIFQQIAQQKGLTPADEERFHDPGAYEKALPILAARYKAFRTKEVDIAKRAGSKFVRLNEEGNVVLIDVNNEEFVASADAVHVLTFVDDDERTELVFLDSDDIANMKFLRDDEKKMYRSMLSRVIVEQRYPGTTVVPMSDSKAAGEAKKNAQQTSSKNDMGIK